MYYTNIKDYEDLLIQNQEKPNGKEIVMAMFFCLITLIMI